MKNQRFESAARIAHIKKHAPVRFLMDMKGRPGPWLPIGWTWRGWRRATLRGWVRIAPARAGQEAQ